MLTDHEIRAGLTVVRRAMAENPAALERIAGEFDSSVNKSVDIRKLSGRDAEMVSMIVKGFNEKVEAEKTPDHAELAAQIVKAYKQNHH